MFEQVVEQTRRATESYLQMQQTVLQLWTQGSLASSPFSPGLSSDTLVQAQKRWGELTLEALNKHREWLDSSYKVAIQTFEKSQRMYEVKSMDDAMRVVEDVWRGLFDAFKRQSEVQFQEIQAWMERYAEAVHGVAGMPVANGDAERGAAQPGH